MKKIFNKRRPKQNFQIDFEKILSSNLLKIQRDILIKTLRHHKSKCKFEYINLLNEEIYSELEITRPTLIKHRQVLIDNHFFKLNKVRSGKSFLIEYRFNWKKLEKLGFLKPIEKSEFSPIIKKKNKKSSLKNGDEITFENSRTFIDDTVYNILTYRVDEEDNKRGIGVEHSRYGKDIKKTLKIQNDAIKRMEKREFIYIYKT